MQEKADRGNQLSQTRSNERGEYTGWDRCAGCYYPDNVVIGFSHTHLQGPAAAI